MKVWRADHVLAVVVPKAREIVLAVLTRGYVNVREDPPLPVTQVPLIAKQPVVMLKPTFDVEVAWPMILNPLTVVVPKPPSATSNIDVEVVDKP